MHQFIDEGEGPLLRIKLTGFWTMETLESYRVNFFAHARRIQARAGRCDMVIDAREFPIQSPEIAAGFHELAHTAHPSIRLRVGILLPGLLAKLQADRAVGVEQTKFFFGEEAEVLSWLEAEAKKLETRTSA